MSPIYKHLSRVLVASSPEKPSGENRSFPQAAMNRHSGLRTRLREEVRWSEGGCVYDLKDIEVPRICLLEMSHVNGGITGS